MDNNFYKRLIEKSPAGYAYHKIICGDDGVPNNFEFIEVNKAFETFTGLKGSDIIGKKVTEVMPEIVNSRFDWIKIYGEIALNGGSEQFDQYSEPLKKWYRVEVSSPEKYYFVTIFIDISMEKTRDAKIEELQETVEKSESEFKILADYAYDWETWENENGNLIYVSPSCERICGYSAAEFIKDAALFSAIIFEGDRDKWVLHKHDNSAGKSIHSEHIRIVNKNGEIVWLEHTCRPVIDKTGRYLGFRANNRDITARKRAEEEAFESKLFIESLLESIPAPVFYKDVNGRYLGFNRAFEAFFAQTKNELIGKSVFDISPPKLAKIYHAKDSELFERPGIQTYEAQVKDAQGQLHNVMFHKATMTDSQGKITGLIGTILDFTDRKQAEIALKESETKYRSLIMNSHDIIFTVNLEGIITFASPAWTSLLGHPVSSVTGKPIRQFIHPDNLAICENFMKNVVITGQRHEGAEYRVRHTNGSWRWHTAGAAPQKDGSGNTIGYEGISRDITDRKLAQEALKVSEEEYRNLIMNSHDIIYTLTQEGVFSFVSPAWTALLGHPVSDVVGQPFQKFVHPDDVHLCEAFMQEVVLTGQRQAGVEYRVRHADGSWRWHTTGAAPQKNADGDIIGYEGLARDVTERRRAEEELVAEKNLLETTLASVGDGVISTDSTGRIVFINRVAELLTGWTSEDAYGKPAGDVFRVIDETTKEKRINIVENVLKNGEKVELAEHTLLVSKDGAERPVEDSAAPIIQEDGTIVGVVLVFRDYSEKKQKLAKIEYLSYHDQLTGLYNRRFYEEELRRLDTPRNLPMTIVMGDVNGLKLVNDSFGHTAGDKLLKKAANVIKKGCRADEIIARLGGDEFVILLPKTTEAQAEIIIERVQKLAAKTKSGLVDISISFGYNTKKSRDEKIQEVFKLAEDHMYRHKISESSVMRNKTVSLIVSALYKKSSREHLHSIGVSEICDAIASRMGLSAEMVSTIRIAGLMHDIGKIETDDKILKSPKRLSSDEWNEIKRHPETGYRILSTVSEFSEIAESVLEHHERWDGKGYPRGLKGEEILLTARIIAIADSYDAMTTDRTYISALSKEDALLEIARCSGTQFDPNIAQIFLEMAKNSDQWYKNRNSRAVIQPKEVQTDDPDRSAR